MTGFMQLACIGSRSTTAEDCAAHREVCLIQGSSRELKIQSELTHPLNKVNANSISSSSCAGASASASASVAAQQQPFLSCSTGLVILLASVSVFLRYSSLYRAPPCRDAAAAAACERPRAASSAARPSLRTALMKTSISTGVAVGFAWTSDVCDPLRAHRDHSWIWHEHHERRVSTYSWLNHSI